MKPLNVKRKKRKEYEKCYFKKAEFVDCDRYVFVSKDENLDVSRIVAGIDLMLDGKVQSCSSQVQRINEGACGKPPAPICNSICCLIRVEKNKQR